MTAAGMVAPSIASRPLLPANVTAPLNSVPNASSRPPLIVAPLAVPPATWSKPPLPTVMPMAVPP